MVEDRRFAGLDRLFGLAGARQIRQSHVVVVGVGGVGSWAAESLARSGVGKLTLIDFDHVAESNINRQIHATEASLGQSKVMAMRERIHAFFPLCQVNCIDEFATPSNWPQILPEGIDAIIDACDQWHVKTVMANWAIQHRAIFVSSGAAGGKRHAQLASVDDLSKVTHDPLLSKVRYQLRKEFGAPREGKKIGVACVYSGEPVAPPDASCGINSDGSLNCHGFGSLVTVTATFGQCAAGFVLNQLADRGGSSRSLDESSGVSWSINFIDGKVAEQVKWLPPGSRPVVQVLQRIRKHLEPQKTKPTIVMVAGFAYAVRLNLGWLMGSDVATPQSP